MDTWKKTYLRFQVHEKLEPNFANQLAELVPEESQ